MQRNWVHEKKKSEKPISAHHLSEGRESHSGNEGSATEYSMFMFNSKSSFPHKVNVTVNGLPIDMELDTGASLSVMSEEMFAKLHSIGKLPKLQRTETVLRRYTWEEVDPRGSLDVMVSYENKG